jgi:hypothetical protein
MKDLNIENSNHYGSQDAGLWIGGWVIFFDPQIVTILSHVHFTFRPPDTFLFDEVKSMKIVFKSMKIDTVVRNILLAFSSLSLGKISHRTG